VPNWHLFKNRSPFSWWCWQTIATAT